MKIGICSAYYRRYPLNERYKMMRSHGYECTDFGLSCTEEEPYTLPDGEAAAWIEAHRAACAEAGVEITQVHGPWRWPPQDGTAEDRAERMEKMKRCLHFTALLGCKYMVVHPIMPFYIKDMGTGNEDETWQLNTQFYRELLKEARAQNVIIALENMPMPQFSIGSPEQIVRFVEEMDDPYMQICLDTGHVAVYHERQPDEAVRIMGKKMKVLHIHDNAGVRDQHLPPYANDGVIDWPAFGRALRENGFEGAFSFECSPNGDLPQPLWEEAVRTMAKLGRFIAEGEM